MAITEQRILKQVSILPASGAINVQWANQVLRNGEVISETFERKAYTQDQLATFHAEVGTFDLDAFTQGFSTTALDAKVDAEAALATAQARIAELEAQVGTPVAVPTPVTSVTPRQMRQALTQMGLRKPVEDAIKSADQDLQDWWEYSNAFERERPQVVAMAASLGVSDAQLDALWVLAATL